VKYEKKEMNVYKFSLRIFVIWIILLFIPLTSFASAVDKELDKQLGHTSCIKSWKYDKAAFRIYFSPNNCKSGECSAALLTIRYIFESNKATFPKKIIIDLGNGEVQSYPFKNIPTLITK
jgi:hypothetical protein